MNKTWHRIQSFFLYAILVFYIILLLDILLFKYVSPLELFNSNREVFRSLNMVPFQTIMGYLSGSASVGQTVVIDNVLGNIVIFMPLGVYLQLFKKDKRILISMIWVFIASLGTEVLQYVFSIGASDIDDIILNCLGGILGILLYRLLRKIAKTDARMRSMVTIMSMIVGIPLFFISILLVVLN